MLLCAVLAWPAVASPAREEADRLRADMEGQVERLRLGVETFMVQQERRLADSLAAQDRRIEQLQILVGALAVLSALLATLSAALAVRLGRLRRRQPRD
ncbi:MAG: hypothetical protein ACM3Q1_02375 [Bacteroidales bacterium]